MIVVKSVQGREKGGKGQRRPVLECARPAATATPPPSGTATARGRDRLDTLLSKRSPSQAKPDARAQGGVPHLAVAVDVGLADHLVDLLVRELLAEVGHHVAQLGKGGCGGRVDGGGGVGGGLVKIAATEAPVLL